jgi:hypothetical protein
MTEQDSYEEDDLERLFRYMDADITISRGWLNDRNDWCRRILHALRTRNARLEAYLERAGRQRSQLDRAIRNALRFGDRLVVE